MLDAAQRLFVANGYAATTVADIAKAAGVAPATVNAAFGGKAGVLKHLVDVAIVGDDEPVPLAEREAVAAITAEPDARRQCAMLATLIADVHERFGPLQDVLTQAAGADPQVRQQVEEAQRGRRTGMAEFVACVQPAAIRPGLTAERATDAVWALTDPRLYLGLVVERGWSKDDYTRWLGAQLASALLAD
jgi:AcrR family transcriptional regulator